MEYKNAQEVLDNYNIQTPDLTNKKQKRQWSALLRNIEGLLKANKQIDKWNFSKDIVTDLSMLNKIEGEERKALWSKCIGMDGESYVSAFCFFCESEARVRFYGQVKTLFKSFNIERPAGFSQIGMRNWVSNWELW